MPNLNVDLEIKDGDWYKYVADKPTKHGVIERVGNLPSGMQSGAPVFQVLITLDDGTKVIAETSWRNMSLAAVGLIARWGTP